MLGDLLRVLLMRFPDSARTFISADGKRFEWRRCRENPSSYDVRTGHILFSAHEFIVYLSCL